MPAREGLGFAPGQVLSGPVDLRLETSYVGREVHYRESVGSTNAVLRELADGGAPEGVVVVAEEQTAGRGRSGRAWHSPPGVGLWFSTLLRPRKPARELAPLSVVTAVSVAEALRRDFGVPAGVKWPNDILAGGVEEESGSGWYAPAGRKLGGILLESVQSASEPVEQLIVGIGLNVNHEERDFGPEVARHAVSMRMLLGIEVDRLDVLRSVLEGFEADWDRFQRDGFESFRARWREVSETLGRHIEVESDAALSAGTVVDISPEGALVVREEDGTLAAVWHGDVRALGPAPEDTR